MTYKGYLLHAGDPKLAEYSEPMPLYADPRPEPISAEPVAWLLSGGGAKNVVVFDSGNAYADPLREVTPLYRHAQPAVDSDFIPKNLDKALGVVGVAIPESREEFNLQAERWIQRLIDRVIRYADEFQEQPAPVVPVLTKADFENWCQKTFALSPSYFEKDANGVYMSTLVHDLYVAWEGCRAAMLNGSNGRKKIRVMALGASIAYGVNSLMSLGRSPVIPDGYVMVPKDLLSDLRDWAHPEIEKYCEMWEGRRDSEFPALRKVITDADALLAAGPQLPGSEPATVPGKWIPVSERMPESNGVYFGWDGKRVLEVNCFFGGFSANQFIHGEITHWMPMPAPPQEGK
ncbi:TPA: DUF551 domain-containing protein [Klebsiella quasipneumoniae subsp. similipneumoniae]